MGVRFRRYFVPSPRRAREVCDISWMCTSFENFRVKGNSGPVEIYKYIRIQKKFGRSLVQLVP